MADLTGRIATLVAASNQHFYVEDIDLREPPDALDFSDPHRWLLVMRNRLALVSESAVHSDVLATLESWSGEPSRVDGAGSCQDDVVELGAGTVEVRELGGELRRGDALELGAGGVFHVRAYRTGGGQPVVDEFRRTGEIVPGRERFLIQFWPAVARQ
ncbi:hypothetical protein PV646_30980 [Streptomyces sp. ID05-26A]|nr:hypothetical protein [Streptomyces sp. ID05-26A]